MAHIAVVIVTCVSRQAKLYVTSTLDAITSTCFGCLDP